MSPEEFAQIQQKKLQGLRNLTFCSRHHRTYEVANQRKWYSGLGSWSLFAHKTWRPRIYSSCADENIVYLCCRICGATYQPVDLVPGKKKIWPANKILIYSRKLSLFSQTITCIRFCGHILPSEFVNKLYKMRPEAERKREKDKEKKRE